MRASAQKPVRGVVILLSNVSEATRNDDQLALQLWRLVGQTDPHPFAVFTFRQLALDAQPLSPERIRLRCVDAGRFAVQVA